ncbi:MAG: 6-phosphogluconolactonase [Verrucomicrobiota bacterium]|jgi:6-phosphogluconolactonase
MRSKISRVVTLLAALAQVGSGALGDSADSGLHATEKTGVKELVFVGGYSSKEAPGIQVADFEPATGRLSRLRLAAEITNPSFLALGRDGKALYAVSEVGAAAGRSGGLVNAYSIDRSTGNLHLISSVGTEGGAPCHVSLDISGRCLFVANYGGGSTVSYTLGADGAIESRASFVQHEQRAGHRPDRQEGPHAHGVHPDPASRFLLVPDLGLDRVQVYRFSSASAELTLQNHAELPAGAGPRHLAFHPTLSVAYVINELDSTISTMAWNGREGTLHPLERVSTLPDDFTGSNTTAEIMVHPSGRFLYGSNRGHDSIAVFGIREHRGTLHPLGHASSGGKTPRFFTLDPSGRWLLTANQQTGNLVVFPLNPDTGMPGPGLPPLITPSPTCLVFVP